MKIIRNIAAAFGLGLSVLAVASLSVMAQVRPSTSTDPRNPVARSFPTEQVAYVRNTFAFNSCTAVANVCTLKMTNASLPYNAAILRVSAVVYTVFNSTTSDAFTIGTTAANANEIVSACNARSATGIIACTLTATVQTATGNNTVQSGSNGGFDLFLKWTAGTGNTATTGLVSWVIEYVMPNDGLCTTVSANAIAPGC
jgi:hypothetical protein